MGENRLKTELTERDTHEKNKISLFTTLQIFIKIQHTKIIKINFTSFQSLSTYNNNNNYDNREADAEHYFSLTL